MRRYAVGGFAEGRDPAGRFAERIPSSAAR
jgi:hypothetical protein